MRSIRIGLASLALLLALAPSAAGQLLFDGSLTTRPDQQDWAFLFDPILGISVFRLVGDSETMLETTIVESDKAGWFANQPPARRHPLLPVLDRSLGYTVSFGLRLEEENHSSPHRSGLSVIVLSSDNRGVEIGFWEDEVWVQTDDPLFNHGLGAALDTVTATVDYELCVLGDSFTLKAGGAPLLAGELRDYSAFGAPYNIPDYVFVGDDTTSASARFWWSHLEVAVEGCACTPVIEDRDGDGTADCADECPDDPGKSVTGDCGCGLPDLDRDGDTVSDCDVVPGDLHPDGIGDDDADLADFLLAHRKLVLGDPAIGARDLVVGDLAPDAPSCLQADGKLRSCPQPDGALTLEDGDRIRGLVADRLALSCEPCSDPPSPSASEARLPGDVAPRPDGGDADVDVADTVQALRWAVGLDAPLSPEELLRADVAPARDEAGLLVVEGDGTVDVGDVLLILRTAVRLSTLAWPAREIHADLTGTQEALAFSLTLGGWPAAASPADARSSFCPPAGIGGLDAAADRWVLTCASEPDLVTGPVRLGSVGYRSPEAVEPTALSAELRLLDAALVETAAVVTLSAD